MIFLFEISEIKSLSFVFFFEQINNYLIKYLLIIINYLKGFFRSGDVKFFEIFFINFIFSQIRKYFHD